MAEHVKWNSNLAFLLAMIGSAVGLGNIWRFPYIFYSNGQGSFLIPYLIAILVLGLPFMLAEYSMGIKYNDTILNIFGKINRKFKYIAWILLLLPFLIGTYYICIVGWGLNYFVFSFTKAWGSNPDAFFTTTFLQATSNMGGLTHIIPYILLAVVIIWFLTWFISRRGLNNGIGKFSGIFVPILFILCIGMTVYDIFLPGAYIGFMRFIQPNWALLARPEIWLAAFGQILFTLSLGSGVILSYSSHLPKGTNLTKNAVTVIFANCGFEIINAIGVFSILGYMTYTSGIPFDDLITEGAGLAFVAFPQVFNHMGTAGIFLGILFFLCILIAGLTTSISFIEPLVDSISNAFKYSRGKTVTLVSVVGFIISLVFTTAIGINLLTAFDAVVNNIAIVFIVIVQCIIYAHIVGSDKLLEVINNNTLFHVGKWWEYIIKYVLPIALGIIWVVGVYELLVSADTLSLVVYGITIVGLLVVPLILYFKTGSKESLANG